MADLSLRLYTEHMTSNDAITIRTATRQDAPAVASLLAELGYGSDVQSVVSRLELHSNSGGSTVVVACHGARVVGVLSFHCILLLHTDDRLGRITSLVVSADYRRHGIGALLIAQAEEFGRRHGCTRMEVTSGDHREDAHAFYQQLDYFPDCRRFIKPLPSGEQGADDSPR